MRHISIEITLKGKVLYRKTEKANGLGYNISLKLFLLFFHTISHQFHT